MIMGFRASGLLLGNLTVSRLMCGHVGTLERVTVTWRFKALNWDYNPT